MCLCHPAKKKKKLPAEEEAEAAAGKMIEEEMSIVVINLVSFFGIHSLTPPNRPRDEGSAWQADSQDVIRGSGGEVAARGAGRLGGGGGCRLIALKLI